MNQQLINPETHPEWLTPHSFAWYAQLGKLTGGYNYSWKATVEEPNGETIFDEEVSRLVRGKTALDIGCGDGRFTRQWSPYVKQIVGIDVTNDFIEAGRSENLPNVSFITTNTKHTLPFDSAMFDFAYNRKGPSSAYLDLKRIMKPGGHFISLHPGDSLSPELHHWFPVLFPAATEGTPILDKIKHNLQLGGLSHANIETIVSKQYLHSPADVIAMRCFGQSASIVKMTTVSWQAEIEQVYKLHATEQGLATTVTYYIVRATV